MADRPTVPSQREEKHPNYWLIGGVLLVLTVIEVVVAGVALPQNLIDTLLIVFAVAKALFVVGYYMHLKFDSRIYTIVFTTGILFTLLLSTTFMLLF